MDRVNEQPGLALISLEPPSHGLMLRAILIRKVGESNPMSKEAEYRAFAASCIQIAHNTPDTVTKRASPQWQRRGSSLPREWTDSLNGWSPGLRTLD